jgi:hypothetical protein
VARFATPSCPSRRIRAFAGHQRSVDSASTWKLRHTPTFRSQHTQVATDQRQQRAYQSCAAIACAPTAGVCGIGQGARTAEYADSRSLAPCHRRHRSGDCAHARVTEVRFCTERDQRRRQGHLPAAVLVSIFALHERRKRFSDFGWTIFLNEMDSFDRKLSAG